MYGDVVFLVVDLCFELLTSLSLNGWRGSWLHCFTITCAVNAINFNFSLGCN